MALDVTELAAYNGKYDSEFFHKALFGKEVLTDVFTVIPNVKNSVNLSDIGFGTSIIQDDDCTFSGSDITLSEKKITVQDKKINVTYCYKDLETIYYSQFLKAGSNNTNAPEFDEAVIMEIATKASNELAINALGTGTNSVITEMEGDAEVVDVTISAVTSTNAIDQMALVYEGAPAFFEDLEDRFFLVDTATYRALNVNAIDTSVPETLKEGGVMYFLGVPVYTSGAIEANTIVYSHKKNMIYATDLVGDMEEINIVDMYQTTAEPNIRFATRFKYDFSYVFGEEIVLGQTV